MASSSAKVPRPRTHTLSTDQSLQLPADLPRRKSAGSLPTSGRSRARPSAAHPSHDPTTAPTTPSLDSAGFASLSPWGGTFLDIADDTPAAASVVPTHTQAIPEASPPPRLQQTRLGAPLPPPPPRSPPLPAQSSETDSFRDSFISIVDDPFFQRYHSASGGNWFDENSPADSLAASLTAQPTPTTPAATAAAVDTGPGPTPSYGNESSRDDAAYPTKPWPPPRRESLVISDQAPWSPPESKMEAVNIAVIGADGVGKSAFIQRALRLPRPPSALINAIRLDVEGVPYIIALIELDLEYFDVDPAQKIRWPKQINGHMVPRIDGALMLYDVMNKDSIRELPPTLSALDKSGLPTILVATKCDNPDNSRQINADAMATVFPFILTDFKTSANVPSNTRDCLQSIVLAAVYNRKGAEKSSDNTTRRRAASSAAHLDTPPDSVNGRPLSKHSRASSDLSLLRGGPANAADRDTYYRGQNSRSPRIEYPNTPQLSSSNFGSDMTDENPTVQSMRRTTGVRLDAGQDSFLDIEESDAESFRYSEDVPILQRNDEILFEKPAKLAGSSFEELVHRLLEPPMNRADSNFGDIFLCLYRKFAAPHELLSGILRCFDATWEDKAAHYLERTATQFRIIEVIARWVALYPGDFARAQTRVLLEGLVKRLSEEAIFGVSSEVIREHLERDVAEDDDTAWAHCDEPDPNPTSEASGGATSDMPSLVPSSSDALAATRDSMRSLQMEEARPYDRMSSDAGSAAAAAVNGGAGSTEFLFHSQEDYEREAATLVPMATLPLNKFRYHIFMDMDANDIADEITRIDWIMFGSIRVRDIVRHVSLSVQEKERCRSLKNINRMISHFNQIAKWVANMILIRDKAKHRAPCLQKFMMIALRLRSLNNYNGLAAVLAGINGTAIHRLSQTRALVDADVQKRFARLVLLMGTQKSHFAYRLAWENSPLPRIPFMPLHRRDLVSAEEGSRTFVGPRGDRINWKKFEILGEVLLPIMRSQGSPYPNLKKDDRSRDLIMDCRMPTDDEEIYQRSLQVEPTSGPAESTKKKFLWLGLQL